jgi:RHS repeat-associated protein
VVAEQSQGGTVPVWYVYGQGGENLYTLYWDNNALTADVYAKDHLGSIRQVVKANGFQFASAELDTIYRSSSVGYSSFYNFRARLYNPRTGRFLTQDTYKGSVWQPWTQNLYVYVGNNPVNYADPTGHWAFAVQFAISIHIFVGVSLSFGLIVDDDLNIGGTATGGIGLGVELGAGVEASLTPGADTIFDTRGAAVAAGGGVGVVSGEVGLSSVGPTYTAGVSAGLPAGAHLDATYTLNGCAVGSDERCLVTIPDDASEETSKGGSGRPNTRQER